MELDFDRLGRDLKAWRHSQPKVITQRSLGELIGVGQSQISELENGVFNALSDTPLRKLMEHVGFQLENYRILLEPDANSSRWAVCLNASCRGRRFFEDPEKFILPRFFRLTSEDQAQFCGFCGELLSTLCDHKGCTAFVRPGVFCVGCGGAYLEVSKKAENEWRHLVRSAEMINQLIDLA